MHPRALHPGPGFWFASGGHETHGQKSQPDRGTYAGARALVSVCLSVREGRIYSQITIERNGTS